MSATGELIIGLVMAVGLTGIIVPVIPGLVLVWASGLAWAILDGGGWARWSLFVIMTALLAVGSFAGIRIPVQKVANQQASKGSLIVASIFAVIGFFVVPVVGFPLGFIVGIFIWNLMNMREFHRALRITWNTIQSFGLVIVIQLLCGMGIVSMWVLGLLLT